MHTNRIIAKSLYAFSHTSPTINNIQKFFNKKTIGNGNNAVIMGNNTFQNAPCMPDREALVLTRKNLNHNIPYFNTHFNNTFDLCQYAKSRHFDELWIIGGKELFNRAFTMALSKNIYIAEMDITEIDSETRKTNIAKIPNNYDLHWETKWEKENNIPYRFLKYKCGA